jgi:type II secretory pathway component GspD/PulD (secretin)
MLASLALAGVLDARPLLAVAQDSARPGAVSPAVQTVINGEVTLARLVDLCAAQQGFEVEYAAADLAARVTIRVADPLGAEELWALTNELLASNGLASVRRPGSRIVSIVRAAEAGNAARIERSDAANGALDGRSGGFQTVVLRARHRDAKELLEPLKQVLSRQVGSAATVGDAGLILVSDYASRIEQASYLLSLIDVPLAETTVETVPARFVRAQELVTAAQAAVAAREDASKSVLRGKPIASADGASVILCGTDRDIAIWKELLAAFDRPPAATTETYSVGGFSLADVATLMEASCKDPGPQGSSSRWKVVRDELTSSLVVTATSSEHAAIKAMFERLSSVPTDERRQVRTFVVRNRPVGEVVEVLAGLIDAVSDATGGDAAARGAANGGAAGAGASGTVLATPQPATPRVPTPGAASAITPATDNPIAGTTGAVGAGGPGGGRAPASDGSAGIGSIRSADLTITPDEGTNSIIVVASSRMLERIGALLESIDVRQSQVMIEALVVGITDDQAVDLGIELSKLDVSDGTITLLSSLFGLSTTNAGTTNPPPPGTGATALMLRPGDFSVLVRALETLSRGRALNIPKVLVANNKQALLTSVLQQPVLSTNASQTVATTSFSGTQDAGTVVSVTPQIAEGDHLLLDYSVEISNFVGDSASPSLPPPRQQNQLKSVVTIPDGFTVAVGGLQLQGDIEGISQIPFIGDIPVLGEAFKSRSVTRTRSKFYVFIRANILRQGGFEDLKYASERAAREAGVDDGFPVVEPQVIR